MKHRTALTWIVAAGVTLSTVVACGGNEPAPPPDPGPSQAELERLRQDSIEAARAAEEARRAAEEAERRAEEARMARIEEARETLTVPVYFEYDQSAITPQSRRVLQQKAAILRASPQVRLRLEGHADERGSNEYNLALGNRRAESVLNFFTSFGLPGNRFSTVSYGEERPAVDESNEEAWAQNRRVEFVITAGQNQISPAAEE